MPQPQAPSPAKLNPQAFHHALGQYLAEVTEKFNAQSGKEHAYRSAFENLLNAIIKTLPENQAHQWLITNEPNRLKGDAPDFDVRKNGNPIGYFETKQIGDTDLRGRRESKNKAQFDRYKEAMGNIAFTDYLSFIFYDGLTEVGEVALARLIDKKIVPLPENYQDFIHHLRNFSNKTIQSIKDPLILAQRMAMQAKHLASAIFNAIAKDEAEKTIQTSLWKQYTAFRDALVRDLTFIEFADSLAQTIVFGLFTARKYDTTAEDFYRAEVIIRLPDSMPFLRDFFNHIVSKEFDLRINVLIDNLIAMFLATNINEVFSDFGQDNQHTDPIIHFYETFLAIYNPSLRKSRGVWYTPRPVVGFMVRAVDDILMQDFGIKDGLGDHQKIKVRVKDAISYSSKARSKKTTAAKETFSEKEVHRVQILDPATGTGAFLSETFKFIKDKLYQKKGGHWAEDIEQDILPRLNAFEILMASYAIAHLHLHMQLQETGYVPTQEHKRLNIYLTNSLENYKHDIQAQLPEFEEMLAQEATAADFIKRDVPVMVVLGNPPYSGESSNKNAWIDGLMEDYKKEPNQYDKNNKLVKLRERNPKWINDDYVKFIRLGQYYIEKKGSGILAFINPHGFLDNPTFRGMRWNLLKFYDKIYTIDLHGNSKKKEVSPDGSADINVFDIQQGVSINIFIKNGNKKDDELAEVFHSDLYGKREFKYEWLRTNSINSTSFKKILNIAPNYFFVPKDFGVQKKYDEGFSIPSLFTINNTGMVSKRDKLAFKMKKNEIIDIVNDIYNLSNKEILLKYPLSSWTSRDGKVEYVKDSVLKTGLAIENFVEVSYRLFDNRWTYLNTKSKGFIAWPVYDVMKHFIPQDNLGLCLCKQFKTGDQYLHTFITNKIIESSFVSNRTSEITSVFPLYCYPDLTPQATFENDAARKPNLDEKIMNQFAQGLALTYTHEKTTAKNTFAPVDVLDYIYAVLHSHKYRETYKAFLKIDFPKVPYPTDIQEFWRLVGLGGTLRELHLLTAATLQNVVQDFPVSGANRVETIAYKDGKVWINATQYFNDVPLTAWEFYIGGYQPAQKWLKDRKGLRLSGNDCDHYRKIIIALSQTAELMQQIGRSE